MATPVTDATFKAEVLESKIPVLVDFWAPWCGPCRMMLPVIDALTTANEGKVKVVKVNVDENQSIPGQYGVMSIPTFLIVKNGQIVNQFVGVKSQADVQRMLDDACAA